MVANLVPVNFQVYIKSSYKDADDSLLRGFCLCWNLRDTRPLFIKICEFYSTFFIPFSPVYKTFMASAISDITAIAYPMLFVSITCIHCPIKRWIMSLVIPSKNSVPSNYCESLRKLGKQTEMRSMQMEARWYIKA